MLCKFWHVVSFGRLSINDQRTDSLSNENFATSIDKAVYILYKRKTQAWGWIWKKWDKSVNIYISWKMAKRLIQWPHVFEAKCVWLCAYRCITGGEDWYFKHIYEIGRIQWHEFNMRKKPLKMQGKVAFSNNKKKNDSNNIEFQIVCNIQSNVFIYICFYCSHFIFTQYLCIF